MCKIYAIKDCLIGFWSPYILDNDQVALRDFAAMVNSDDPRIRSCRNDLELYRLGEFQEKTGVITAIAPEFIARGASLVRVDVTVDDPDDDLDGGVDDGV